ncbi:MAG: ribosome small subunit-dependent GTPase A [bacterium]
MVIKSFNNYFLVAVGAEEFLCTRRGRFKKERQNLLTGDQVGIIVGEDGRGTIEIIQPRLSELVRPPIANVDRAVVVVACHRPEPNFYLLDKLLVMVEQTDLPVLLVVNKIDRLADSDSGLRELWAEMIAVYRQAGYPVLRTSAKTGEGLAELREACRGRVSVLAGASGVGKSSLLNALQPGLALKTGETSAKIGRGRHTTRHVELLRVDPDGFVADTPGFTAIELPEMAANELIGCFPEMYPWQGRCRFSTCLHWQEPDCAVKAAVAEGEINAGRYEHYCEFLREIKARERRY